MKRTTWGFLTVFTLLLVAGIAVAQDDKPQPASAQEGKAQKGEAQTGNGLDATSRPEHDGGLWMPYGASTYTWDVDILYKVIFWVTTGMFILVEGLLVVFCIIYRRRPGHRPTYTHGNNVAEITWTVIPGLMLFAVAVVQIPTWHNIKDKFPDTSDPKQKEKVTEVHVLGQQFKWQMRYPGMKEKLDTENEVWTTSNIHMPAGNTAFLHLRSADVIHSVFIPHMRVKQDAVPGLRNRIWFKPSQYFLVKLKDENGKFLKNEDGIVQGKKWDGSPRRVQPREWIKIWDEKLDGGEEVDPDAPFKEGGRYYDKKIAVNPVESYFEFEGWYDVPRPGGSPKPVKVLYQGKVTGGQPWDQCDYALGVFEIACAELCGYGHYTMRGLLIVEPKVVFESWLESIADFDDPPPPVWKFWKD